MEDQKNHHSDKCSMHGGCFGCGHDRHFGLRWILGFFILFFMFWLGVKVGELKGFLDSQFGYGGRGNHMFMMRQYGGYGQYPVTQDYPLMMKWQAPKAGIEEAQ